MTWIGKVRDNLWLLGECRDWPTLRAMKQRAPAGPEAVQRLHLRGFGAPILYRPGTTDVSVAWELFHGREYDCTRGWDFSTVVDCGANVGMFLALVVKKSGPRLRRYVGVEADGAAFGLLERQAAAADVESRSVLLQAAAWHQDGEVRFDDRGPSWGRHVSENGGTRVRAMTIESILDAAGLEQCDLLKLDIEGGERTVLPRMSSWGPRVRMVVAELHGGLDYPWFAAIAEDAGFQAFPPGALFRRHPAAIRREVRPSTFGREARSNAMGRDAPTSAIGGEARSGRVRGEVQPVAVHGDMRPDAISDDVHTDSPRWNARPDVGQRDAHR